jgi:hypothetical protein
MVAQKHSTTAARKLCRALLRTIVGTDDADDGHGDISGSS